MVRIPKELTAEVLAAGLTGVAVLLTLMRGNWVLLLAGAAIALMILGALPRQRSLALLVGASVILLGQSAQGVEGFEDGSGAKVSAGEPAPEPVEGSPAAEEAAPKSAEEDVKDKEGFGNRKPLLPDNATRKEPLELGKPYKLPSENDDQGYHLDSGTTFLNAYKALKPDQIAAMTRDTQELMATQKNLMSLLDTMKPMLADGQNLMNMFGGYFGSQK